MRACRRLVVPAAAVALLATPATGPARNLDRPPLARVELHLAADAYSRPHVLLMTLGGPIYCGLLGTLQQRLRASLVCPDYGPNRQISGQSRSARQEDWGDPDYLRYVATLPDRLRARGVRISKLVLVGVSYSGYANAQLLATHPELRPSALVVVDSYLDLPARFRATLPRHPTHLEIQKVLGGSFEQRPAAYGRRSPSNHLWGLAEAIRTGTRLVVVWSVSPRERREFVGATCSREANALWLGRLAGVLRRPVPGYVTRLRHAQALRRYGDDLLALAGLGPRPALRLPATEFSFAPGGKLPAASYCGAGR